MENKWMTLKDFLDTEPTVTLNIIMGYDNFTVMKGSNNKTYVRDEETQLMCEVVEIARVGWSDQYGDMTDEELIGKYDADFTGELDDCDAYVYYKIKDDQESEDNPDPRVRVFELVITFDEVSDCPIKLNIDDAGELILYPKDDNINIISASIFDKKGE